MDEISISLSESEPGGISEIRVDGVVDTTTASELERVVDALLKRERFRLIFDLAGVDYVSSAGWGVFIAHLKEARERQGDIKLANMAPNVHEIYELLEFDRVLKVYNSVEAAREDFRSATTSSDPKKKARGSPA